MASKVKNDVSFILIDFLKGPKFNLDLEYFQSHILPHLSEIDTVIFVGDWTGIIRSHDVIIMSCDVIMMSLLLFRK